VRAREKGSFAPLERTLSDPTERESEAAVEEPVPSEVEGIPRNAYPTHAAAGSSLREFPDAVWYSKSSGSFDSARVILAEDKFLRRSAQDFGWRLGRAKTPQVWSEATETKEKPLA
jgi:hypothetical protein